MILMENTALPEYRLIRSRRRTISVEIAEDAGVIVRAPKWLPLYEINAYVAKNADWIREHAEKIKRSNNRALALGKFSRNEIEALHTMAVATIPEKVQYYAQILGVTYGRITIRNQKTLWGSCNAKGNLSFNCLLMKAPEHVRNYVIVHELCHRMEMNHSKAFWAHVATVIPDYGKCRKWLRDEGSLLLRMMP